MSMRKRISAKYSDVTSGGGPDPDPANVQWEPIEGGVQALIITVVDPAFNLTSTVTVTTTPSVSNIKAVMDAVAVIITPSVSNFNVAHSKSVTIDVQDPVFTIPSLLAVQDTWVPEVALCPDDTNKNGTNLEVDGVVATRKDSYVQFKTDTLVPAGATATVSAATLTINVTTAPSVATNAGLSLYTNVTGTFNETTATCSSMPPANGGATTQTESIPAATGELVITLSAGMLTALATELNNQRRCLFQLIAAAATTIFDYQSKDSGGSPGNAFGPRLALTFSIAA